MNPHGRVAFLPSVTVTLKSLRKKEFDFEPKSLGEHIKRERLKRGLTQKEVAKLLGVSPWTVLNWETGATEPPGRSVPTVFAFLAYDPNRSVALAQGREHK